MSRSNRLTFEDLTHANFTYAAAINDFTSSVLMAATGIEDRNQANAIVDYFPHVWGLWKFAQIVDCIGERIFEDAE